MPAEPQQVPPSDAVLPNSKSQETNVTLIAIIIIVGIFATTLPQSAVLGKLPLQNVLKNELHLDATALSSFFFISTFPWYLKPLAGILTDAFPFFGTRRRAYLLLSSLFAALSWIAIGVLPHNYGLLLLGVTILNVFMVVVSTVVGAVLVETGQSTGATGRLSAVRQAVSSVCTLVNGPLTGFLATAGLAVTGGVNAAFVASVLPVAYLLLRERKISRDPSAPHPLQNAGQQLRIIGKSRNLWFAILFIGLFYFSPGISTPLLYRQQNELKFSLQSIGNLGIFSGALGIVASLIYGRAIRRFSLKSMIVFGIATAGLGAFFYLPGFYHNYGFASFAEGQNGLFFNLAEVALIDMAARATPKGCEGLGYSLILSARNFASQGADLFGSFLSDHKVPFNDLVYINAVTTLIVLILLPFLPRALMSSRDTGEATEAQPA